MSNFYVNGQPTFIESPELGTVVSFGKDKVIANKLGLKKYTELLASGYKVVAFVCEEKGNNIIFFAKKDEVMQSETLRLMHGVAIAFSDSFKQVSETKGTFIAVKYGDLKFWSDDCFVPYVINGDLELDQLASQIKDAITDLAPIHKTRVAQTLDHVASYEDMGIPEEYSLLVSLHLLLYRPKEPMYNNFKKQLEGFTIGQPESTTVDVEHSIAPALA